MFALRWRDLTEADQCLTVREAVYEGIFGTPKTEAGARRVPLSQTAWLLLDAWKAAREANRRGCADLRDVVGQTHCTEQRAAAMGVSGLRGARNTARELVDVPSHVLPVGARQGRPRQDRRRSPWVTTKVDTTLNIYIQVLDASVRTAVAKVGDELFTIVHRPAGTTELIH